MLSVENISKTFRSGLFKKNEIEAVRDMSFSIEQGKTLGLVGESGCGKTTVGRLVVRLIKPTSGKISFNGVEITDLSESDFKKYRPKLQIIFQNPNTSLNPRMKIRDCISEPLKLQSINSEDDEIYELLDTVNLHEETLNRYPHEVSGGEVQRVVIARAISLNPELIVADEPTSNLDISVQAQILGLLKRLQREYKITYIFISHDLEVIKSMSDRIAVMLAGRIIEEGPAKYVIDSPLHPYTQDLKDASSLELNSVLPDIISDKKGCPYARRCSESVDLCFREEPQLKLYSDHKVACLRR